MFKIFLTLGIVVTTCNVVQSYTYISNTYPSQEIMKSLESSPWYVVASFHPPVKMQETPHADLMCPPFKLELIDDKCIAKQIPSGSTCKHVLFEGIEGVAKNDVVFNGNVATVASENFIRAVLEGDCRDPTTPAPFIIVTEPSLNTFPRGTTPANLKVAVAITIDPSNKLNRGYFATIFSQKKYNAMEMKYIINELDKLYFAPMDIMLPTAIPECLV